MFIYKLKKILMKGCKWRFFVIVLFLFYMFLKVCLNYEVYDCVLYVILMVLYFCEYYVIYWILLLWLLLL